MVTVLVYFFHWFFFSSKDEEGGFSFPRVGALAADAHLDVGQLTHRLALACVHERAHLCGGGEKGRMRVSASL